MSGGRRKGGGDGVRSHLVESAEVSAAGRRQVPGAMAQETGAVVDGDDLDCKACARGGFYNNLEVGAVVRCDEKQPSRLKCSSCRSAVSRTRSNQDAEDSSLPSN